MTEENANVTVTEMFVQEKPEGEGYAEVSTKTGIKETGEIRSCVHWMKFGDNFDEAVANWGADAVYDMFNKQVKVDFQRVARQHLKNGNTEKLSTLATEYTPGMQLERSPSDVLKMASDVFDKAPQEQQEAMLKSILAARGLTEKQIAKALAG